MEYFSDDDCRDYPPLTQAIPIYVQQQCHWPKYIGKIEYVTLTILVYS